MSNTPCQAVCVCVGGGVSLCEEGGGGVRLKVVGARLRGWCVSL